MAALRVIVLLAGVVALVSACGSTGAKPSATEVARGKQVFKSAGCGSCHSLSAAGSKGFVGGPLDGLKLKENFVEERVRHGGGGMPRFDTRLSDADIRAVAAFVSQASGR